MKKLLPLVFTLLCLLACSGRKAEPIVIPEQKEMGVFTCSESRETDINKAMEKVVIDIIKQISEECSSNYYNYANQESNKGTILLDTTHITSTYACGTDVPLYSALVKPTDTLKAPDGSIVSIEFCVKNSDAAKPYLEKQRILAEDMEMAIVNAKEKSEAWLQVQNYWNDFMGIQIRIEGLGVKSKYFDLAKKSYEEARNDYKKSKKDSKDFCKAKIHWNPEKKTLYSEIAFSKLSGGVKMENTPCAGKGISLIYKGTEPFCKSSGGPYGCSYQPSLRITSCNGAELRLLESPAPIKGFDQKQELALKKLQDKLKTENFWNEWEQEIKQRSPQCE